MKGNTVNTRTKIAAACTAAIVMIGIGIAATPAIADEAPPAEQTVVAETPAVEAPPAAEPAPAPVVESAPVAEPVVEAEPEAEPVTTEPTQSARVASVSNDKLPICHSGSGAHWSYIAPDANGYNGHKNHDLDIYGLTEAECLAKNPVVVDEPDAEKYGTLLWKADNDGGDNLWPQHIVVFTPTGTNKDLGINDALADGQCGWFQADVNVDNAATAALVAGGVLYGPSNPLPEQWPGGQYNGSYSKQWFESSGCATTPETPTYVCGDVAPVVPGDTEKLDYTLAFNADLNRWRVKVVAIAPYTLASGQVKDEFFFDKIVCPPNHDGSIEKDCGIAYVHMSNPVLVEGDTTQQTASFVIYVDGDFYGAYAVAAGETEDVTISFGEDTGDHKVVLRSGPAQGDEKIAKAIVCTDCVPPEPETKVEYGDWTDGTFDCGDTTVEQTRTVTTTTYSLVENEWVANEPVVTEETQTRDLEKDEITVCPVHETPPPTGSLAFTNGGISPQGGLLAGGILLGLGAFFGGTALIRRRLEARNAQQ